MMASTPHPSLPSPLSPLSVPTHHLHLGRGHADDADRRDDEEVERGAPDDGEHSEAVVLRHRVCVERGERLDDGEKDLGGAAAERHQREVGDRLIPHEHRVERARAGVCVPPHHGATLTRDHLRPRDHVLLVIVFEFGETRIRYFVHSSIRLFIRSFVLCPFVRSLICLFIQSSDRQFVCFSFICSFIH